MWQELGSVDCGPEEITVKEVATGARYNNKPEWAVTITNDCQCTQNNETLECPAFQYAKMVKPPIVSSTDGTYCHLSKPIPSHSSINFTYVSDIIVFKPIHSSVTRP